MRHSEEEQEEEECVFCLLAHEKMRLVLNATGISIPACASFQAAGASDLLAFRPSRLYHLIPTVAVGQHQHTCTFMASARRRAALWQAEPLWRPRNENDRELDRFTTKREREKVAFRFFFCFFFRQPSVETSHSPRLF